MLTLPCCECPFEPGASSTVDPNLFSGMRWRNIGPSRGGRVTTVAGVVAAGQRLDIALQSVLIELYEPRYTGQDDQMLIRLAQLKTVLDQELPAYNQLLQSRGLPTIRK